MQRQGIGPHGGGAELRVGAFAQTLKQLQVALQQMTLQVGDIRQCDDTLIEHVLNRAPHFCPAMQIALRIGEVQARLQGGHLLRQPGDVQILIGRWQGRILVGEDGVGEEVGARLFIVGVQAAQGQLDQRAVVIVMADIGDEASGADQQVLGFQVVDVQLVRQPFQPLIACQRAGVVAGFNTSSIARRA